MYPIQFCSLIWNKIWWWCFNSIHFNEINRKPQFGDVDKNLQILRNYLPLTSIEVLYHHSYKVFHISNYCCIFRIKSFSAKKYFHLVDHIKWHLCYSKNKECIHNEWILNWRRHWIIIFQNCICASSDL